MSDNATQERPFVDILERFSPKRAAMQDTDASSYDRAAHDEETDESTDAASYRAYTAEAPGSRVSRLMLYYPGGIIAVMAYAYLIEAISTSHQYISLVFTNCVITLEGRNLTHILALLQAERVKGLHCFDARHHESPGDADAPVITAIERRGLQDFMNSGTGASATAS